MLEPAAPASEVPRALLQVGGLSVARQQLALALALQCQRVICIARGLPPGLVALQHVAERAGAQFNVVVGARPLVGLVTAADDVVMLGDGLFVTVPDAAALLEKGPGVLAQPIEQGLAAGFERIDLNHASAAAMRLPGRLVERLAELPVDCDAFSALQRIALQEGVPLRAIPSGTAVGRFWALVRNEDDAHLLEPRWIRERIRSERPGGPGQWLAGLGVRALGPAMLHAGSGSGALTTAAVATGLLGLVAGWFGVVPLGLGLAGLGWILGEAGGLLRRVEDAGTTPSRGRLAWRGAYGWGLDAILVAVLGWGIALEPGQSQMHRYFAPVLLLALLRIVPRATGGRWTGWLADRALLSLLLAAAFAAGVGSESVHFGALVLALAGIAVPRGELRLTRP